MIIFFLDFATILGEGWWVENNIYHCYSCLDSSALWTLYFTMYWRRQWHPTPVLLPGKSHGRRSLVGCSPWGRQESDTTEWLHFHFSLSCIGEGNGNPLQCSCLENPRDGRTWWAAVYGITQSQTQLKRPSSSSSMNFVTQRLMLFSQIGGWRVRVQYIPMNDAHTMS